MPRVKDKPLVLNEEGFVDWLLEIYYYRFLDQGIAPDRTPLRVASLAAAGPQPFLLMIRAQMARFELTFPLTKIPMLYAQALREVDVNPKRL